MKTLNLLKKQISKIGLGTGRFGAKVEKELAFEMLDYFFENGGNVIDTARNYYEWVENGRGMSEQCIGAWMAERGNRDEICLCTKGGVRNRGNVFTSDLSKAALMTEAKESLEALHTDFIDIYLLHRDEPGRPVEEIVEAVQEIKETAKVSMLGVANWQIGRIKTANEYAFAHGMEPFRVVQTWWSLAEYTQSMWDDPTTTHMDLETYEYMEKYRLLGMAYTSQCKGFFQKAFRQGLDKIDPFLKQRIATPTNIKKFAYIKSYCEKNNVSPTAVVNGYITSNPLEGIALVSVSNMEQLKDILNVSDYSLDGQFISEIDAIVS